MAHDPDPQAVQHQQYIKGRRRVNTFTHYVLRYFIILYTLRFKFPYKCLNYALSIIFGIVIFISIITTLFYFPITGYISISVCTNASNTNNFTNSTPLRFELPDNLSVVFSAFIFLYFILGIYSLITIFWNSNFLEKVCKPKFIYSDKNLESGILEYNYELTIYYFLIFMAGLASSGLFLTLSQQFKLNNYCLIDYKHCNTIPEEYIMCSNFTLYQIALNIDYVFPFFVIGTVVWHLTPIVFALSLYFILNIFHDKVFDAIDQVKQYILNHGRPNEDNAPMKPPLRAYYEVIDYINEIYGASSGLKLLLILNIIQVAVGLVILILNFESVILKKNPFVVGWIIAVYVYHFLCVLLTVIKILYLNKTLHHFPDSILSDTDILDSLMPLRPTPATKEFYLTIKEELQIISLSRERFEIFSIGDLSNVYIAILVAIPIPILFVFYLDQFL